MVKLEKVILEYLETDEADILMGGKGLEELALKITDKVRAKFLKSKRQQGPNRVRARTKFNRWRKQNDIPPMSPEEYITFRTAYNMAWKDRISKDKPIEDDLK